MNLYKKGPTVIAVECSSNTQHHKVTTKETLTLQHLRLAIQHSINHHHLHLLPNRHISSLPSSHQRRAFLHNHHLLPPPPPLKSYLRQQSFTATYQKLPPTTVLMGSPKSNSTALNPYHSKHFHNNQTGGNPTRGLKPQNQIGVRDHTGH